LFTISVRSPLFIQLHQLPSLLKPASAWVDELCMPFYSPESQTHSLAEGNDTL